MDKIPNYILDDLAQTMGKQYFVYLKQNWNKEGYVKNNKFIKWKPLSPDYKTTKLNLHGDTKILVATGKMLNSFDLDYLDNGQFQISTKIPYAKKHQMGNKDNNLAARPMLYLDIKKLKELGNNYLKNDTNMFKKWIVEEFKNIMK